MVCHDHVNFILPGAKHLQAITAIVCGDDPVAKTGECLFSDSSDRSFVFYEQNRFTTTNTASVQFRHLGFHTRFCVTTGQIDIESRAFARPYFWNDTYMWNDSFTWSDTDSSNDQAQ